MNGDGRPDEFWIGSWFVEPSLNQLSAGDQVVHLRPKVMDVLAFLAQRPGEVVSKEAIIDAVWAKKFLADTALSRAVFELREALGDDPHQPSFIETIPKRGYRLIAPVTLESHAEPDDAAAATPRQLRGWLVAIGIGGLVVLLVAGWRLLPARAVPVALAAADRKPRIVMLPFEGLGPYEDAAFARGVSEEIASRLNALSCAVLLRAPEAGPG